MLSIVFLLSVFLVVQFFLSQEVTGKDKALEQPQRPDRRSSTSSCRWRSSASSRSSDQVSPLNAGLASAEAERDRIKGLV